MFGIGTSELAVILVVALIVVGPKRLPEIAKVLGKSLAELRRATGGLTDELNNARTMLEEEVRAAERAARLKTVQGTIQRAAVAPAPVVAPAAPVAPAEPAPVVAPGASVEPAPVVAPHTDTHTKEEPA